MRLLSRILQGSLIVPLLWSSYAFAGHSKTKIASFAPPDFPPTTIENDGTFVNRPDARKTMVWLDENMTNINSWYFIIYITTTLGQQFELIFNPLLIGLEYSINMFGITDITNLKHGGATWDGPATGSREYLNYRSQPMNFTSPAGGDNFTQMFISSDYAGFKVNIELNPTGKNLYNGGMGGFDLVNGYGSDYSVLPPGWTWYWANPTLRIKGTLTVGDTEHAIDYARSFGHMERQSGQFTLPGGYYAYWLWLSNGVIINGWILKPGPEVEQGYKQLASMTAWHPNGLHEVIPVDTTSYACVPWTNPVNNHTYETQFVLDLSAKNSYFHFGLLVPDSELYHANPGPAAINISEAYAQGTGTWDGKKVTLFGHVEQLLTREQFK